MRRLELTKFCNKNLLYTLLHGGFLALHSCSIIFDREFILKDGVMIVYRISTRLVPKNNEVEMILPAGMYSIEQFNQNMHEAIKGKGGQWVAP